MIGSAGALSSPRTGYGLPPGVTSARFIGWGLKNHGVMVGSLFQFGGGGTLALRSDSKADVFTVYPKLVEPNGDFHVSDSGRDINDAGVILGQSGSWGSDGPVRDGATVRWREDGRSFRPSGTVRALNEAGAVIGSALRRRGPRAAVRA